MKRKIERGWELERKMMIIPTVAEIMRKQKISREEAAKKCIIICGQEHKNNNLDCHRKLHGYSTCDGCPKYPERKKLKLQFEWELEKAKVW